jgi:hypothetical protein
LPFKGNFNVMLPESWKQLQTDFVYFPRSLANLHSSCYVINTVTLTEAQRSHALHNTTASVYKWPPRISCYVKGQLNILSTLKDSEYLWNRHNAFGSTSHNQQNSISAIVSEPISRRAATHNGEVSVSHLGSTLFKCRRETCCPDRILQWLFGSWVIYWCINSRDYLSCSKMWWLYVI